jgi:hypothetical protein
MDETLELVCKALDELADSFSPQKEAQTSILVELVGWHTPSLSLKDLANIPRYLAKEIRDANIKEISEELKKFLDDVPNKLLLTRRHTIPQIVNLSGNTPQAIPAYMATIEWVSSQIRPLLLWQSMQDPKGLPPHLLNRLKILKREVDEVSINKEELTEHMKLIQDARETAESLPSNLIALKDARKAIENSLLESNANNLKILELKEASIEHEKIITERLEEAKKLIEKCEEAYKITTTQGLAGAFEERAKRLDFTTWAWVGGLLAALAIGAWIGSDRLNLLTKTLSSINPDTSIIIMQSFLSALSLGAPLWFAWLATKQIGQRFRLSEDYAFKALVAKAYEGYRKEAARIDPEFEKRLFDTALKRVEEPPLRLVEDHNHGSPWNELLNSSEFKNMPSDIKNNFLELIESIKKPAKSPATNKNSDESK